MNDNYWQKQLDKPLYPDLLWSRPENKLRAGKLLIISASSNSISLANKAYTYSLEAGIGNIRLILPDSLEKIVPVENAIFLKSNSSGSLAKTALAEIIDNANWADALFLPGDKGNNSETSELIESLIQKYTDLLIINEYSVIKQNINSLINRDKTIITLSISELQKLLIELRFHKSVGSDMGLLKLIDVLHELTKKLGIFILTYYENNILISYKGKIVTQKINSDTDWQIKLTSFAAVWALQNSNKIFEAICCSVYNF